ncbi:MAG: hypothetical protein Q4A84_07090 [Neisseria sp.]|uniref:hypothetical protein n=1 Tax=Neisseria sp. TaxID=192066 RepID=UPI0026DAE851|nr:hypothetical protein [Neisseria sp.]MDO4641448.1 hypothetical protein [Neisseria sp.]
MKKISKNIQYLRSTQEQSRFDLEDHLRRLLSFASTVNDTQVEYFDFIYRIQYRNLNFVLSNMEIQNESLKKEKQGIAIHIVHGVKGEHMRTMNNDAPIIYDEGDSLPPPNGQSYVAKEAYLYINEHHILFVGNGLRHESICTYLNRLNDKIINSTPSGEKSKLSKINLCFEPVANLNNLELIKRYGAKKLHLNASIHQLSMIDFNEKLEGNFYTKFKQIGASICRRLMKEEATDEENKTAEDIHVCLELSLEGNTRATLKAQEFITQQAMEVVESDQNDSEFYIETRRGDKIRPTDVRLFKKIQITKYQGTNTLSQSEVFDQIRDYFHELEQLNLIEL